MRAITPRAWAFELLRLIVNGLPDTGRTVLPGRLRPADAEMVRRRITWQPLHSSEALTAVLRPYADDIRHHVSAWDCWYEVGLPLDGAVRIRDARLGVVQNTRFDEQTGLITVIYAGTSSVEDAFRLACFGERLLTGAAR